MCSFPRMKFTEIKISEIPLEVGCIQVLAETPRWHALHSCYTSGIPACNLESSCPNGQRVDTAFLGCSSYAVYLNGPEVDRHKSSVIPDLLAQSSVLPATHIVKGASSAHCIPPHSLFFLQTNSISDNQRAVPTLLVGNSIAASGSRSWASSYCINRCGSSEHKNSLCSERVFTYSTAKKIIVQ